MTKGMHDFEIKIDSSGTQREGVASRVGAWPWPCLVDD